MKRWTSVFATQSVGLRETHGLKAIEQWLATTDGPLILLFLSQRITAFPISRNQRPCTANRYAGPVLDLSDYYQLEFAVFPETYDWSLVHTHEDGASGGPYFIRSEYNRGTRDIAMS